MRNPQGQNKVNKPTVALSKMTAHLTFDEHIYSCKKVPDISACVYRLFSHKVDTSGVSRRVWVPKHQISGTLGHQQWRWVVLRVRQRVLQENRLHIQIVVFFSFVLFVDASLHLLKQHTEKMSTIRKTED